MKIECTKTKLEIALTKAERVVGKHTTLPVLECVYLEAKGSTLTIRATNLDIGIEIEIPVKVSIEGVVAVPGNVLARAISGDIGGDTVVLDVESGNLVVASGKSSTVIKSLPHDDFPTIPHVSGDSVFTIPNTALIKGMKNVWYSASISAVKPELGSVYLYSKGSDIVFVATDSFRLGEKIVQTELKTDIEGLLIPSKNIPEIIRSLEDGEGDVLISVSTNQISFTYNNVYITSRLIDGSFPDYKQIIPKKYTTTVIVLKQDLIATLKKATIFSGKFHQVTFVVSPQQKTVIIKSQNPDVGENTDEITATIEGEEIDINFNYKYIIDCMQSIESDSVSLELAGPGKPMVIKGIGDRSFFYLVMPMNR
ncbi:DNA polymerase III subunit beta [Candidatus Wolfebacteria bacterium]|nr:MAG: DNA polymerase III subunit beta [Candidatus Wolfebacteria bacterium]